MTRKRQHSDRLDLEPLAEAPTDEAPSNGRAPEGPESSSGGPAKNVEQGEREVAHGYGYYGASEDAGPGGFNPRYWLGVLVKHRWSAITAFVVVLTFVVITNYTAVPVYRASARVLVETDRLNLVDIEDVIDQQRSLDAELAILRSRWLASRTVESLGLLVPDGQPTPRTDNEGPETDDAADEVSRPWSNTLSAIRTFASKALGVGTPVPQASELPDASFEESPFGESLAEARRINAFLGGLTVFFVARSSTVLDIRYEAAEPILAARFANTHAQQYINQSLERRFSAVEEVTDWLADRLAEQRQKVDASEEALAQFRETNGLTTIDGASPTLTRLNELTISLTRTQAERLEQDALYNQALALRRDPDALDQLPLMLSDPTLRQRRVELEQLQRRRSELSATLRDRHPDMVKLQEEIQTAQARLETERNRLLESLQQDVLITQAAEDNLTDALETLKLDAIAQDRKSVQLSVLIREADSNRQIYDLLLQRARETGVAREINTSRTRVLDRALVPTVPVRPDRQGNILRGIGVGFLLAIAVAVGFERLDSRVKSPADIGDHLGIPFIGLLPEVKRKDQSVPLLATEGVLPQFAEELRQIRTNVLFSFSGDTTRSVVISSASPGEGKTVVASNLSVALAQTGERVLLVDADMRRPMVHTTFQIPREPGLSNVLVGNANFSQAVQTTDVPNLWILPAGRRPPNPSELLGSEKFKRLLAGLGEGFAWVLFDTPPGDCRDRRLRVGARRLRRRVCRRCTAGEPPVGGPRGRPGRKGQRKAGRRRAQPRGHRWQPLLLLRVLGSLWPKVRPLLPDLTAPSNPLRFQECAESVAAIDTNTLQCAVLRPSSPIARVRRSTRVSSSGSATE